MHYYKSNNIKKLLSKIKSMKIVSFERKIKKIFETKRMFYIFLSAIISKSLSFTWILWDAILSIKLYKHQKIFPDHFLRFLRLGIGVGWLLGFVSSITAGIFLICDGAFSIYRYRSLRVTKSAIEDIPRLIRISTGLLMFPLGIWIKQGFKFCLSFSLRWFYYSRFYCREWQLCRIFSQFIRLWIYWVRGVLLSWWRVSTKVDR